MGKKSRKFFIILSLILSLSTPVLSAEKRLDFPRKPIRLIVPYAVGSGNDIQSRGIAPYLGKQLGVTVLVDNIPGADSRIGLNEAWKAKPDGYTLVNPGMPTPIVNEKLFPVNYKTLEFTHIFAWAQDNIVLMVNSDSWKTPQEFIAAAQSKSLAGGNSGIGSVSQIAGLQLEEAAKFKPVNWVPFGGGSETMTQLAGKHVDFGITTVSSAKALVDAGKLRPILIFSTEKDPTFPDAPLSREVGLNLTAMPIVRGVMAPPGLSPQIANILEQAFSKAVQDPDFLSWAQKVRVPITPIHHDRFLAYSIGVEKEVFKYLDKIKIKK